MRIARAYNIPERIIRREWTLCEIADAHEALDIEAEREYLSYKDMEAKNNSAMSKN